MDELDEADHPLWEEACRREAALRDLFRRFPGVPGFDQYLGENHPHYRPPGTQLLPISIRNPVLAGVGKVAMRPDYWVEQLLAVAGKEVKERALTCFRSLPESGSFTAC